MVRGTTSALRKGCVLGAIATGHARESMARVWNALEISLT